MADVLEASAEPVTLIPTGPLTNIATFLTEYPRLEEKFGCWLLSKELNPKLKG